MAPSLPDVQKRFCVLPKAPVVASSCHGIPRWVQSRVWASGLPPSPCPAVRLPRAVAGWVLLCRGGGSDEMEFGGHLALNQAW